MGHQAPTEPPLRVNLANKPTPAARARISSSIAAALAAAANAAMAPDDASPCPICHEPYTRRSITALPCAHLFCYTCISAWEAQSQGGHSKPQLSSAWSPQLSVWSGAWSGAWSSQLQYHYRQQQHQHQQQQYQPCPVCRQQHNGTFYVAGPLDDDDGADDIQERFTTLEAALDQDGELVWVPRTAEAVSLPSQTTYYDYLFGWDAQAAALDCAGLVAPCGAVQRSKVCTDWWSGHQDEMARLQLNEKAEWQHDGWQDWGYVHLGELSTPQLD